MKFNIDDCGFNIDDYKNEQVVMHCKTEKEAKEFCTLLHIVGKTWSNGGYYITDYIITRWDDFKEDTCYDFNKGFHEGIDFYKKYNYRILEWSDFTKFILSELKIGDICVYRNGNIGFVLPTNRNTLLMIVHNKDFVNLTSLLEVDSYTSSLKLPCRKDLDIMDIYRPKKFRNSGIIKDFFNDPYYCDNQCEHVYHRDTALKVTLEEVAKKFGVDEVEIV